MICHYCGSSARPSPSVPTAAHSTWGIPASERRGSRKSCAAVPAVVVRQDRHGRHQEEEGAPAGAGRLPRRKDPRARSGPRWSPRDLNFPGVKLVGIVNADTGCSFPISGPRNGPSVCSCRCQAGPGRALPDGKVLIQTFRPGALAILMAREAQAGGVLCVGAGDAAPARLSALQPAHPLGAAEARTGRRRWTPSARSPGAIAAPGGGGGGAWSRGMPPGADFGQLPLPDHRAGHAFSEAHAQVSAALEEFKAPARGLYRAGRRSAIAAMTSLCGSVRQSDLARHDDFATIEARSMRDMLNIVKLGDPILLKHSLRVVPDINGEVKTLVSEMFDAMERGRGVGLAAVQVGELLRVFVTKVPGDIPRVFINPDILETSIEQAPFEEGCLSIPGMYTEVIRPTSVRIQAWNAKGRPFTLSADGYLAARHPARVRPPERHPVHRPDRPEKKRPTARGIQRKSRSLMRILFAGTPSLAVPALEKIARAHQVIGCADHTGQALRAAAGPRILAGQESRRRPRAHGTAAGAAGRTIPGRLKAAAPQILVVAAFGRIFRQEFLDLFPHGRNQPASVAPPRFRGPSPVSAAILAGDAETGVTIQRIALKFDTGDILAQERIPLTATRPRPP